MAARRKKFPCGHRGRGQYCHRCHEEERKRAEKRAEQAAWENLLEGAPIPLSHLPKNVAKKTYRVIRMIESGSPYMDFVGKRLTTMGQREIISIPIGWSHRLICREEAGGRLAFVEVITHETYNTRLSSGGWSG